MKNEVIEIEINNWDKYIHRKDMKSLSWFRVNSDIMHNPKLHKVVPEACWFFVCLLGFAAKKMSKTVSLPYAYLCDTTGCEPYKCLEALEKNGLVRTCTDLNGSVANSKCRTGPYRTGREVTGQDETDITIHDHRTDKSVRICTNTYKNYFGRLYFNYPRKEGKKRGLEICKKIILSAEMFGRVDKAILRYKSHCEKEGTEKRYIKQFSTFMNNWEDWDSDDAGSCTIKESKNTKFGQKDEDGYYLTTEQMRSKNNARLMKEFKEQNDKEVKDVN